MYTVEKLKHYKLSSLFKAKRDIHQNMHACLISYQYQHAITFQSAIKTLNLYFLSPETIYLVNLKVTFLYQLHRQQIFNREDLYISLKFK